MRASRPLPAVPAFVKRAATRRSIGIRFGWRSAAAVMLAVFSARGAEVKPRMMLLDGAVVGGDVIAVGERGTILRSTDNAQTWQSTSRVTNATLTAVSFAPAS